MFKCRSLVLYASTGAVVLVGGWWLYTKYKKSQYKDLHSKEEQAMDTSRSNSSTMVDEGNLAASDTQDMCIYVRPNDVELRLSEVELVAQDGAGPSHAEADVSGGSNKNHMDSLAFCYTLGTGDGHQISNHSNKLKSQELIVWQKELPKHLVRRLNGKRGRSLRLLYKRCGAKAYISDVPGTDEVQLCRIEGTENQVCKALAVIYQKCRDWELTSLYDIPELLLKSSLTQEN